MFDHSQMSWTTLIDFLPEFMDKAVDEVRPHLTSTLGLAMDFVKVSELY
jgi:hypothetical protein